ncbi:hypothetical protein PHLCEN_2v13672 [Hermanssonia centrifuga]|uniref:BTB domain-containing protein n=1 Tax=Hermanssonia centrifuga TaxID=98765 RepID=A0A2R6NDM7_9APHY|nr:hypothetical protein PHLCEN_2v13672 [Hermanssonia centrifuga]
MADNHTAPAPFDQLEADTVLRTSDTVDFYVHKSILMVASSVFETMFSLPQPADAAQQSVIHVSEDSRTLEYLLRFCYPLVDNPVFDDLSKLEVVLESAMKYEATEACASLRRALQNLPP